MKTKIYPSVLNCDQMKFAEELAAIKTADGVHLDIMDNHFVPNLTWGLPTAQAVLNATKLPVDAHLMIEDPDRWAPEYAKAGCAIVCFHLEASKAPVRTAEVIRSLGAKPGIALNPATPVSAIKDILGRFDQVTLMSVEPGFGGQGFIPEVLPKIKRLRKLVEEARLDTDIQVDGGVNDKTVAQVVKAGANVIVSGSFVFKRNPVEAIADLRKLAENPLA
ncbi:MAG: ribulose-phosphate 3-epimerase [Mobiluncus porci]|uniref:Ribulose-phosphate 3-epimerase n=1 Tax=Mobiluncus porci TaxID=2652278 RepID=A0A7K0K009_9ACTO|nr:MULTISPECIES: ribulose-phosphate 3-epimerase [Mobiluncus]MCI6585380.1 ribulose-phosphate 3-epimerase [Mobiluncus sp.]MDD7541411.1 ribulose-phosphate 3-epimerase [Mobiluncus porci]MDY5748396.1 ribulose-phosphate 3-epimerase [Mobiluncus porci]MST48847.1 ribulose-phosphate 3-epimerase [Mobiluncus porci]